MKNYDHIMDMGGAELPKVAKPRPTIQELREYLDYDPETGVLRWRKRPARSVFAGSVVLNIGNHGYLRVQLRQTNFLAHRVAFALHHGRWPTPCCDHINGVQTDNRIVNLRECSLSANQHNAKISSKNTTGVKGVARFGQGYQASVSINGVRRTKYFCHLEDAGTYVKQLREQLHGDFARHI